MRPPDRAFHRAGLPVSFIVKWRHNFIGSWRPYHEVEWRLKVGVADDVLASTMRDPREGLNPDGTIRTGVCRNRVPGSFEPVVSAAVDAFEEIADDCSTLLLYGSVATGAARRGLSDVDLVAFGPSREWCHETGMKLSSDFSHLCRGVEISSASHNDFSGKSDECFGNQVFLKHYCVALTGTDLAEEWSPFQGDWRAARGFNGDIAACFTRWRQRPTRARSVARKTLFAASGVVSVLSNTWTTNRETGARLWGQIEPRYSDDATMLLEWCDSDSSVSDKDLKRALSTNGIVASVADRFASAIGLWQ